MGAITRLEQFINDNITSLISIVLVITVLMFIYAYRCFIKAFQIGEPRYLRIAASAILTAIALIALVVLLIL